MKKFASVYSVNQSGWLLFVQGAKAMIRLPFTDENNDSRNPDLMIGNIIFVELENQNGRWIAKSYETIRSERVSESGREVLSWETLTTTQLDQASRGFLLFGEPEYRPGHGYVFEMCHPDEPLRRLMATPTGCVTIYPFEENPIP